MDRRSFLKSLGLVLPAAFAVKMTVPADIGTDNKAVATNVDKGKRILVVKFADSPAGQIAWYVWNKMSDEQKQKTGLLDIKPEGTVFMMPGLSLCMVEGIYERVILEGPKEDKYV